MQILKALELEAPNFLSDPIWMEGPWEFLPKTPVDRVADCMARAPTMLQKSQLMPLVGPQQQVELAQQLIIQGWEIDAALQDVYDDMHMTASGPLYWPVPSQINNPTDVEKGGKLFPVAYHFRDLMTASTLMLYWATRVMLLSGLCRLYQHIETISRGLVDDDDDTFANSLRPPNSCTNYVAMAHNVCQSVEYCLQDNFMMSGAFYVTPALSIATGVLKDRPGCAREVAWMRAAMDIVQGKGLRIMAHKRL